MTPIDRLVALLHECTVQVSGVSTGTGFFVAPRYLLTNAHVAGSLIGVTVKVRQGDEEFEGTVRAASPPPRSDDLWPYPDLALVEVTDGRPKYRCVWLDRQAPERRAELVVVGHSQIWQRHLALGSVTAWYGGDQRFHNGTAMRLTDAEIPPGMSGGPVLNTATGGVCAVVKAARRGDTTMGGLAVPLRGLRMLDFPVCRTVLREHDRYHDEDPSWRELLGLLAPPTRGGIGLDSELRLRRILADLPESTEHEARYFAAAGPVAFDTEVPQRDHSDVVTDLGELIAPAAGPPPVWRYAAALARDTRGPLGERLRDWVLVTAGRLGLDDATVGRHTSRAQVTVSGSVIVRLRPIDRGRTRYELTVWRWFDAGGRAEVADIQQAMGVAEAFARIREILPRQLAIIGRQAGTTVVELVVPRHLMDEAFEDWRIWPTHAHSRLGRRYPVVLRDLERFEHDETLPQWERRWQLLEDQDVGALIEAVHCRDRRTPDALEGWMERSMPPVALVLPRLPVGPPGSVALQVALDAGVPVVLWPRDGCGGCPEPAPDGCRSDRTFTGLRAALRGTAGRDLPEKVRGIRNEALAADDPDHCGTGVVMVWDNPYRRPPRHSMSVPTEG
jgi:hypothetical protein